MNRVHRPRLLEVLYSFGVGGSELVGLEFAKYAARAGVDVLCTSISGVSGPLAGRFESMGIQVIDLGLPKQGLLSRNGVSIDLVRKIASLRIDAVHFQHFLSLNKLGLPARFAGVRRLVVTEHSVHDASQSFAGRLRIRSLWRLADVVTAVHPQITSYLVEKLGIDERRAVYIPVGVDVGRWHRADRSDRRLAMGIRDEFVFAFVGRFAPVKDVPGLIRAYLAAASRSQRRMRLLLAGNGEEMQLCRAIAAAHPLGETISFLGEIEDPRPVLAGADAFVMNSRSEGTPRAILEAMSAGLPCVCPSVGGIPSMLQERGYLFDQGDSSALETLLWRLAQQDTDQTEMCERAREFVRQHYSDEAAHASYLKALFPACF